MSQNNKALGSYRVSFDQAIKGNENEHQWWDEVQKIFGKQALLNTNPTLMGFAFLVREKPELFQTYAAEYQKIINVAMQLPTYTLIQADLYRYYRSLMPK
jgi:hypothetical protein